MWLEWRKVEDSGGLSIYMWGVRNAKPLHLVSNKPSNLSNLISKQRIIIPNLLFVKPCMLKNPINFVQKSTKNVQKSSKKIIKV
ncbi:MAG: hypothetical protein EB127_20330 [Alphaproteobacteria bacterium]|nr:hypothetical protein [Alphaproteobacteria bacterium]